MKTPCKQAWEKALAVNEFQRTAETYRETFTDCENVAEWQAENRAHDNELGNSTTAIDNFCRNLGVKSDLCTQASGEVAEPLTPVESSHPRMLTIECDDFMAMEDVKEKLKITDGLLRHFQPRKKDFNLNVSLDFGSAVEQGCDPDGDGAGTPFILVADVAEFAYDENPDLYGGY